MTPEQIKKQVPSWKLPVISSSFHTSEGRPTVELQRGVFTPINKVKLIRKCRNYKASWERKPSRHCLITAVVNGKKYAVTSDALMEMGLLKTLGLKRKLKVKIGSKWIDY